MKNIPRPKVYDNLTQISLMLEHDMVELAKYYNINISDVCRNALKEVLSNGDKIKKYQPVDKFVLVPKETLDFWHEKVLNDKSPARTKIRACAKMFRKISGKTFTPAEIQEFYKGR